MRPRKSAKSPRRSRYVQSMPSDGGATTSSAFCFSASAIDSFSIFSASAFVGFEPIFCCPNSYWSLRRLSEIRVPGLYLIVKTSPQDAC